jgi:mRNA interferase MazF
MKRGELYLVEKPGAQDPRKRRVFVIVSRQRLVDSQFSTLICAPVYSRHDGLSTQVPVGTAEGLKKESSIHCDELVSLPKSVLTHYVGSLKAAELGALNTALTVSLELEDSDPGM